MIYRLTIHLHCNQLEQSVHAPQHLTALKIMSCIELQQLPNHKQLGGLKPRQSTLKHASFYFWRKIKLTKQNWTPQGFRTEHQGPHFCCSFLLIEQGVNDAKWMSYTAILFWWPSKIPMVNFRNTSKAPAKSQYNHSVSIRILQTEHTRVTHKANKNKKKRKAPLKKAASTKEVLSLLKLEENSETNFPFPVTGSFPAPHGTVGMLGFHHFSRIIP